MATKPRVHEIASEYGADSRVALDILKQMGEYVKGPSSSIESTVARRLGAVLEAQGYNKSPARPVVSIDPSRPGDIAAEWAARLNDLPLVASRGLASMDPNQAIGGFENALRKAIFAVLGDGWLNAPGAPSPARLEARREEERKRRDGVNVPESLIEYTMTTDVTELVIRNWEQFRPVFNDQARTKVFFSLVGDVRNTIAHGRQVLPHERDLIAGAAGQIRLQVSEYLSSQGNGTRRYYPKIERLTDDSGRSGNSMVDPPRRVEVGDKVTVSGLASAGRGHPIRWWIAAFRQPLMIPSFNSDNPAIGNEVTLEYQFTTRDVGEEMLLIVGIASTSKYQLRAETGLDDWQTFEYSVSPPD